MEYIALKKSADYVKALMGGAFGSAAGTAGAFNSDLAQAWARNIRYYYSNVFYGSGADSSLEFSGKQGELVRMIVPEARALNQQLLTLITKQKLNFSPMARTTDQTTLADTKVAKALCDHIIKDQKLDMLAYRAAELCTLTGSAFYAACWDPLKGKPAGIDNEKGELLFEGDLDIDVYSVYDIDFNFFIENFDKVDLLQLRKVRNKWDLCAKYPQLADKIKMIQPISKEVSSDLFWHSNLSDDYIFEYHAIHRSTPALPEGRYTVYCDHNTIMFDDHNPYKRDNGEHFIPVVQMRPEPILGTAFGYPMFSNILPLQEMSDYAFSAAATNNAMGGVQSILNPVGNNITVSNLGGLSFLNYTPLADPSGGKPEPLQLTKSAPELYKFLDLCSAKKNEIYNISGALKGQPPPGVTSGTAIATLSTNAIEFLQGFSKANIQSLECIMDMSMWIFKGFCQQPRMLEIAGDNNEGIVTEFQGSDLSNISRIKMVVSNPLLSTAAGALEVATQLLSQGLIKDPQHYFQILEGAPPEVMWEKDYNQESLINKENDMLRKAAAVPVLITDKHAKHIQEHLCLLDDPMIRIKSDLINVIMMHIKEHMNQAMQLQTNPVLMSIMETGQMPPPGAMPPMGAPPMIGAPPTAEPAQPAQTQAPEVMTPNAPQVM